jgi:UPF0755 protein
VSAPGPVVNRRARPVFQGPTYMAPKYHSKIWGRLIFIFFILLLAVVIIGGGGLYWMLHRAQGDSAQVVIFPVRQGDNVNSVADFLAGKGYISSTLLFRLDARIHGLGGNLSIGDYTIRRNMSIDDMVGSLSHPKAFQVSLTVPEGWRAAQIAERLTANGIDGQKFLNFVKHPDLRYLNSTVLRQFPPGASLEGYLFPDTYKFNPHEDPRNVALTMVQNMDSKFTPAMRVAAAKQGRTVFQELILASIVEREARIQKDRPIISSVYNNRLALNPPMRLDADPTVQYAVGKHNGRWWPVLWDQAANIRPQNIYNTYTHDGLPPGPIANPGLASIQAALYPTPTNYLYFVACKHGGHLFAVTLDQQTANQQKCGS